MKKKVLPVAANFRLNKKAKNKKRGAFSGAPLFFGKICGKYFIGTAIF